MEIKNKFLILSNTLKTPLLRNFLVASLLISVIFPLYTLFYVIPSFRMQLTANTEDEAIRTALHLKDLVIEEKVELTKDSISKENIREIEKVTEDFRLEKLKIFSKHGKIIFSTIPNDIGEINKNDYFQNVVAKGHVYTQVVRKNTKSLESRIVTADVVETYVPLIYNGEFRGAFEIYYDITARKEKQDSLLAHIYKVLFAISLIFLMTIIAILLKASNNILERRRAESQREATLDALRDSEKKYRDLFDCSHDALMTLDPPLWHFSSGNPATVSMFRVKNEEEFISFEPWEISPERQPDGHASEEKAREMIETTLREGSNFFEWTHKRIDGEEFPTTVLLTRVDQAARQFLQATVRDITEQKRMENMLRFHGEIVHNMMEGVYLIRASDGVIVYANPQFERMFGYDSTELVGKNVSIINAKGDRSPEAVANEIIGHLLLEGAWSGEVYTIRKDGTTFWCNANVSIFEHSQFGKVWISVHQDISKRKRAEEALRKSEESYRELSIVDALTKLYNSRHFYNQLQMEIDRVNRYEEPMSLILLDVDNFKDFNDAYGHVEGDEVLMRLGQVIKRCLRKTDTAYRYGGEEFTIVLPITNSENGVVTAERIRTEFKKEKFSPVSGLDVHLTVSIGFAQYKPQESIKAFVQRVDQLMYTAKKNGKDRVCSVS